MSDPKKISPFLVKDCALATIATGIKAQSLLELRDKLLTTHPSSVYFHFWGGRLRTSFEHSEYHNDFSSWVHYYLHDDILSERLELLNPREYTTMEQLRDEIVELIENRLDEHEYIPWVKSEDQFHFIKSKIVIFHTPHSFDKPSELINVIPHLTSSSLFYHFIDAARRTPQHVDDFSKWLEDFGDEYQHLIAAIRKIDPYFISLSDLQQKLITTVSDYFLRQNNESQSH